jgi:hypothetical protein
MNKIVSFEKVAPGILIPEDTGQPSYWRDKLSNKCKSFDHGVAGLCKHYVFFEVNSCTKDNIRCKWNGYGNKG